MILVSAFLAGGLFGLGLCVSGMTDTENVLQFLDIFGKWNPRLALVMIGAIGVFAPLYPLIRKRSAPVNGGQFRVPSNNGIDSPLLIGALIFGIGWGLSGFCPGPAIAALASFKLDVALFVAAMAVGMLWVRRETRS